MSSLHLDVFLRALALRGPSELLPVTLAESLTRNPGHGLKPHSHPDELQLELITGTGSCEIAGRRCDYAREVLLLIPPGTEHGFGLTHGRPMRHLTVKVASSVPAVRDLPVIIMPATPGGSHERIRTDLRTMVEEWQLRPPGFEAVLSMRLATILIDILRHQDGIEAQTGDPDGVIDAACRFMAVHYGEALPLDRVARHCGVRSDSLCRKFRRHLATTPGRFLLDLRLRHAQALLRSGYSVTESAQRVGFTSIHHFSKAFRTRLRINPSAWAAGADVPS